MNLDDVFGHEPKIYNIKNDKDIPKDAVYCMRPSKWGNPYKAKTEADREWACNMFEEYVMNNKEFQAEIKSELKGKDLVCCCWPKRCHTMTLKRVANE